MGLSGWSGSGAVRLVHDYHRRKPRRVFPDAFQMVTTEKAAVAGVVARFNPVSGGLATEPERYAPILSARMMGRFWHNPGA
jgi:hypothetical protein